MSDIILRFPSLQVYKSKKQEYLPIATFNWQLAKADSLLSAERFRSALVTEARVAEIRSGRTVLRPRSQPRHGSAARAVVAA
jgi:hypothetical protein